MENTINEEQAQEELKKRFAASEEMLNDEDKIERFLQRLEKKMKVIPVAGDKLSQVPVMASMLRSYIRKGYTDVPIGTIIAITSALLYFVSPLDLIPDSIPILGYFDDAAVVAACWKLVSSDVEEYIKWRDVNGKTLDI